ncbi:MAG: alpha/beta hydrolase [Betaproteobacteria bacterium]|nr:alpha/beta hydrolase [Betaproteobacteria bacterium]
MKLNSLMIFSTLLFSACGMNLDSDKQSELSSEKFAIAVLGIEMGSCTREELTRFVAGEYVPAISDKLPRDQQIELRQKFGRVLKFPAHMASDAIASPLGAELKKILGGIFPRDYSGERVEKAFFESVADGSFTLLEFVSQYPTDVLRVNGIAFMSKKAKLEKSLIDLERKYQGL